MVRVAPTEGRQSSYSTAVAGSGLVSVDLDLKGRLRRFVAIPTRSVDSRPVALLRIGISSSPRRG